MRWHRVHVLPALSRQVLAQQLVSVVQLLRWHPADRPLVLLGRRLDSCARFFSGVASGSFGGADGRETGSFSQRCIRACLADTHEAVRGLPCMGRLAFRVEFYAGARGPFGALITGRRPSPPVTCAPSSTSWPAACRATVRRAEGSRRAQADVHHGRRRPGPRGPTCGRGVLPECVGFPSP